MTQGIIVLCGLQKVCLVISDKRNPVGRRDPWYVISSVVKLPKFWCARIGAIVYDMERGMERLSMIARTTHRGRQALTEPRSGRQRVESTRREIVI